MYIVTNFQSLSNPTELEALVGYVVDPAPEDADELRRIVFPCKVCILDPSWEHFFLTSGQASEILSLNSALQVLLLNDESLTSKLMNMIAQGVRFIYLGFAFLDCENLRR